MTGIRIFSVHYLWEDCVSMVLGVLIALTSWMVGDAGSQAVAANAAIVGILVLALGASEFLDLRRWEEGLETALAHTFDHVAGTFGAPPGRASHARAAALPLSQGFRDVVSGLRWHGRRHF